jgi:hypothetical protein
VYAELCRVVMHRNCNFGDAAALMARSASAELAAVEVGGKPFASWDQSEQTALLLATVIHYATGENEGNLADRWTEGWGAMHISPLMSAMRLRVASWLPVCSSVPNSAIGPSSGIA